MTDFEAIGYSLPNVESLTDEDLERVCMAANRFHLVCTHTLRARKARKQGLIAYALMSEETADIHYQHLPESLRW